MTFFLFNLSVLSPILNMPISDSKRQRVLVTACVLYSEVSSSLNLIGMLNDVLVSNIHVDIGKVTHLPLFCFLCHPFVRLFGGSYFFKNLCRYGMLSAETENHSVSII